MFPVHRPALGIISVEAGTDAIVQSPRSRCAGPILPALVQRSHAGHFGRFSRSEMEDQKGELRGAGSFKGSGVPRFADCTGN